MDAETAAGGGHETAALTTTRITGVDDNTAQAGQLVATTLTHREGKGPDSDATTTLIVAEPEVWQQQGSKLLPMGTLRRGNGGVTGGVPFLAHALTAEGADASEDGTGRGTPLVPVAYALSARHFGVGQGHVQPVAFNETAGGNSAHEGISPPVKTGTGGSATSVSVPAMAVRRLTPTECERLQGYPDGWTATSYGRQQADAPRYRQLGNSIAVPVFEWVSGRLVEVDQGSPL